MPCESLAPARQSLDIGIIPRGIQQVLDSNVQLVVRDVGITQHQDVQSGCSSRGFCALGRLRKRARRVQRGHQDENEQKGHLTLIHERGPSFCAFHPYPSMMIPGKEGSMG